MGFLGLCKSDPLLNLLRDTFDATPLRVPDQRIKPLYVIAKNGIISKFVGRVDGLFSDIDSLHIIEHRSKMANVTATKSQHVKLDLGLDVMDGFLKGMGVSSASIKESFDGATKVSFSFQNVVRHWLDIGLLGKLLSGKILNASSPTTAQFLNHEAICMVIDSVITSNNFSMSVEKATKNSFKLNIPKIEGLLKAQKNSLVVQSSGSREVSFKNPTSLTFAFSGIIIHPSHSGKISFELVDASNGSGIDYPIFENYNSHRGGETGQMSFIASKAETKNTIRQARFSVNSSNQIMNHVVKNVRVTPNRTLLYDKIGLADIVFD